MQLEIESAVVGDRTVVTPRGEIDLVSQLQLKQFIHDLVVTGQVHLVVDLTQTTFLDSTGLGALIGARRMTHAFKGSFALVCPNDRILKIFRITSLDKLFAIHTTFDELADTPVVPSVPVAEPQLT